MFKTKKYRHSNRPFIRRKGVEVCVKEQNMRLWCFQSFIARNSGYVFAILYIDRWPKTKLCRGSHSNAVLRSLPMLHTLNSITQHNNTIANCRCRCCIPHLLWYRICVEYVRSEEPRKLPWSPLAKSEMRTKYKSRKHQYREKKARTERVSWNHFSQN